MRMIWHLIIMDICPMTSIRPMSGMSMVMIERIITIIRKSPMTMDTMMKMEMNLVDVEGKDEEVDLVDDEEIEEEVEGDAVDEVQEKGKRTMKRWRWRVRTESAEVVKAAKDGVDDALPGNTIRVEDWRARMVILLRMVMVVVDVIIDDQRPKTNQGNQKLFGPPKDQEKQRNPLRLTLVITNLKRKCLQKGDVAERQRRRVLNGYPKVPSNTRPIMAFIRQRALRHRSE